MWVNDLPIDLRFVWHRLDNGSYNFICIAPVVQDMQLKEVTHSRCFAKNGHESKKRKISNQGRKSESFTNKQIKKVSQLSILV